MDIFSCNFWYALEIGIFKTNSTNKQTNKFWATLPLTLIFEYVFTQIELDGPTTGPDAWSGPIGQRITEDVWLRPVVAYTPIPGKIQDLPDEVVKELSRDALLLYKLGIAVQTGIMPPEVAAATIGPPLHARWLTTAERDLRYSKGVPKIYPKFLLILIYSAANYSNYSKFKKTPFIQNIRPKKLTKTNETKV